MKGQIINQDSFYRRGLVLGLTLAEIMILLIFIILLLLTFFISSKNKDIKKLKTKLNDTEEQVIMLEEKLDVLIPSLGKSKFDNLFNELVIIRKNVKSLQKLNDSLKKKTKDLQQQNADLEEKTERYNKLEEMFKKHDLTIDDKDRLLNEVENRLRNKSLLENCRKQKIELIRKGGKGTGMPSCWYQPNTTKPEYIFDIFLTSNGLFIKACDLPHREDDKAELPINKISFEKQLTSRQFIEETNPIFLWSEKNDCRFFVRAFDCTLPEEKKEYKRYMRVLEDRFYKYEIRGEENTCLDILEKLDKR